MNNYYSVRGNEQLKGFHFRITNLFGLQVISGLRGHTNGFGVLSDGTDISSNEGHNEQFKIFDLVADDFDTSEACASKTTLDTLHENVRFSL